MARLLSRSQPWPRLPSRPPRPASPASFPPATRRGILIHAYSLVHDDLPCMDDDILRRGKPTCHVEYDEAAALLVGDSLQSLAFELLAGPHLADTPQSQLNMIKRLAQAAGSRGMAGGKAVDLANVGEKLGLPELEFMHIHKNGALFLCAVMSGAPLGNTSTN